ncbi:Clavaminate synthase-like protein [Aaosphaeria arxii CBS 175.79]|uniref:Clavaminate synthase-like protein n=1 Tax=Aaosphaeria arxii CBS 175.79 TaxID=1450172 RepID=A0A6A5XZU8_9PLEO|nr:Clavaminate synthase-like protein [Aaosphaeria arxii CBS 175.79]KAF2018337.1 Clavaminate synthase-like protein [Aaosphaeria arxii CBS 175.79]
MDPVIPIVDFDRFLHGTEEQKREVARGIDNAFQEVGFVYLKNHGVAKALIEECFAWSEKFFSLPLSTKQLSPHPPGGSHHRGYSSPGLEKVTQNTFDAESISKAREIPDCKESFESGNPLDKAQPNIWPPPHVIPGFREFLEGYFTQCGDLVHKVLECLGLALGVDGPGLAKTHSDSLFQLRLLHYPAIAAEELKGGRRSRINAHSDFGTLTLLFQDAVGGLEVEDRFQEGVFREVEPVEGAVLVNVGDLMARWSNDRWRSTVHRVGVPKAMGDTMEVVPSRYSIPFFATADPETVIEALPGCWGESRPKKYETVTAWGYVQMRMAALYE